MSTFVVESNNTEQCASSQTEVTSSLTTVETRNDTQIMSDEEKMKVFNCYPLTAHSDKKHSRCSDKCMHLPYDKCKLWHLVLRKIRFLLSKLLHLFF